MYIFFGAYGISTTDMLKFVRKIYLLQSQHQCRFFQVFSRQGCQQAKEKKAQLSMALIFMYRVFFENVLFFVTCDL